VRYLSVPVHEVDEQAERLAMSLIIASLLIAAEN
jgi:hypothetical protein